jgi:Polysaccharide lyase
LHVHDDVERGDGRRRRCLARALLVLSLSCAAGWVLYPASAGALTVKWRANFNDCAIPGQWDVYLREIGTISAERGTVFEGTCAASVVQGPTSAQYRVELQSHNLARGGMPVPSEAWYRLRYFPISLSPPTAGMRVAHFNQFRTDTPCYTGGIDADPAGANPDRWKLSVVSGSGCGSETRYDLGTISYSAWNTILLHYKWSRASDGFVEAWVNGVRKLNKVFRATTIGGATKMFLRVGIYSASHPGTTKYITDDDAVMYP